MGTQENTPPAVLSRMQTSVVGVPNATDSQASPVEEYRYTPLRTHGSTRLLVLKASKLSCADLYGELMDIALQECEGDMHGYEALSYVWGHDQKPRYIWIGNCKLHITKSLHEALLRLRYQFTDRVLWIDAICIDQANDAEKSIQVSRMATVYSKASRVRVWLGETADGSDEALISLANAGNDEVCDKSYDEFSLNSIRRLLSRDWFGRVWVLQEVAAARHVVIMCGGVSVDGYAFCVGLQALRQSGNIADLYGTIGSTVYLIRGSIFRLSSQSSRSSQNSLSLGQLVDMYRHRKATKQHDRIYALLGMCSDHVPADLMPNYERISWDALFGHLARYVFGPEASIQVVHPNIAMIKTEGTILGHISSSQVDEHRYDMQVLTIASWSTESNSIIEREWTLHASAIPVQSGDIIFRQKSNHNIAILRPEDDFFSIITASGHWKPANLQRKTTPEEDNHYKLLLVWDWTPQEEPLPTSIDGVIAKSHSPAESTVISDVDATTRLQVFADALMSAYVNTNAEQALLALERSYQKEPNIMTSTKLDCSKKIAIINLRLGRFDEAEKRFTDIYLYAKTTLGSKWLSQTISQFLAASPHYKSTWKASVWKVLKSVHDRDLPPPQFHVEMYRVIAGLIEYSNATTVTLLIDLGEILTNSLETTVSMLGGCGGAVSMSHETLRKIEEGLMEAAASNTKNGQDVMRLLLAHWGSNVQLSVKVAEAAIKNLEDGLQVMKLLLEKRPGQVQITETILETAAGVAYGPEIIELFLEKRPDQVQITDKVVEAAAGNGRGPEIMELLFEKRPDQVQITDKVVEAAAGNGRGPEIMELLFEKRPDQVQITDKVVEAAAGNGRGREIIKLLLEQRSDQVQITDKVVEAAAGGSSGRDIMELLFEKRPDQVQITEKVLETAAGNTWGGLQVMVLFFEKRPDQVQITEKILEAAAGVARGQEIMKLLFEQRSDQVQITDKVVEAAAGNQGSGRQVIGLLFEKRPNQVQITEKVLEAAAGSVWDGRRVIELFFENRPDQVQITDKVAEAAAWNRASGREVMELLLGSSAAVKSSALVIPKALIAAFAAQNFEMVNFLLQHGAENAVVDINGVTPLIAASGNSHIEVVKMQLYKDADWTVADNNGWTPLHAASANGHTEAVRLLLDKGADWAVADNNGWTPLHAASANGHTEAVRLLLDKGADWAVADNSGWTPLNPAAYYGELEVVGLLLGKGADWAVASKGGWRPLYSASYRGQTEVVKILLEKDTDVSFSTKMGMTPLHAAACRGHCDIIQLLLRHGANICALDIFGRPPFFYAIKAGHTTCLSYLQRQDFLEPDFRDVYGSNALSVAIRCGHNEMTRDLMSERSLMVADRFGRTPVWWAHKQGCMYSIKHIAVHLGPAVSSDFLSGSPAKFAAEGYYCAVCLASLEEVYHECNICGDGDGIFAMCLDCFHLGARCLVDTHTLTLSDKH